MQGAKWWWTAQAMPSLLIQKAVAKDIMIHTRYVYVSSLILLWLISAYTAIAQSEKTPNQNLQSESRTLIPPNWASPGENTRAPQDMWVPPDINTYRPSVVPNVSCSLPDVISRVGTKVQNLVHNLDRFSATEVIEHENVARSGNLRPREIHKFNYVFSLRKAQTGTWTQKSIAVKPCPKINSPMKLLQRTFRVLCSFFIRTI